MKLDYRNGLLFTSIKLNYKGESKIIHDVIIDTGATESIISPDIVEDIGIYPENDDEIFIHVGVGGSEHYSYAKDIDIIQIGENSIKNLKIDFGIIDPKGQINGLIGLDILTKIQAIINLKEFLIS